MLKFKDEAIFLWIPALPGIFGFLPLIGAAEWLAGVGGPAFSLEQVLLAVTLTLPVGFPFYCIWFHRRRLGRPLTPAILYLSMSPTPIFGVAICLYGIGFQLWHWSQGMVLMAFLLALIVLFLPMALFSIAVYYLLVRHSKN